MIDQKRHYEMWFLLQREREREEVTFTSQGLKTSRASH